MISLEDDNNLNLIELTSLFWWDIIKSSDNHNGFNQFLSPYCRIQDDFNDYSHAVNGKFQCEQKLIELKNRIKGSGLDPTIRKLKQMLNNKQIRFLIYGRVQINVLKSVIVSLGIAIEWQNGYISGIVIVKNVDKDEFFQDTENIDWRESTMSLFSIPLTEEYEQIKWDGLFLGNRLNPPYLVPRPPLLPPTVSIHIISCHNLQSRLIRYISRPINCCVSIKVGNVQQSTQIIKNNPNPIFCKTPLTSDPFVFQIPTLSFLSGYLEIFIEDTFPLKKDTLAIVHIPYSLIPFQQDTITSNDMFVRLSLLEPYILSPPSPPSSSSSSSLQSQSPSSTITSSPPIQQSRPNLAEPLSRTCFLGDSPRIQKEIFQELKPYLKIRISKVDVLQWWLMEEIHARDQVRENNISQLEKEADISLSLRRTECSEISDMIQQQQIDEMKIGVDHSLTNFPSVEITSPLTPPITPLSIVNEEHDKTMYSNGDLGNDTPTSNWERYKYESIRWVTSKELW